MLVFLRKLLMSSLRWVPICQGSSHFSGFLNNFERELATSIERVKLIHPATGRLVTCILQDHLAEVPGTAGCRTPLALLYFVPSENIWSKPLTSSYVHTYQVTGAGGKFISGTWLTEYNDSWDVYHFILFEEQNTFFFRKWFVTCIVFTK